MAVPNIFATATTTIPLSQLDANFATAITLGNTAIYLGNTTTSIGNLTLTGAVVNGTVGATTPNTGAFTTGSFSGAVSFAAGTVSAPSIYLSTDTGTGFYRIGANNYGFAVSASKVLDISSTGFAVTGTLYSSGNFYSGGVANGQTPDATHAGQAITTANQMYNSAGATSADSVLIRFYNTNGLVGTINVSGSATAYNTSSDQRLKEDLGISTDVSVLQNLKIHDFKWKVDGSQDRGVFAQEAYQVKPSAIRVGSDDIDKYGHLEKPWSADYSKFVPDLIVGWKNHEDRIARLEAALANAGISFQ